MTNPVAAQDRCPTRLDLDRGLRLIADVPQHSRIFSQNAFGVSETPVDASGQAAHFADLPEWLDVSSPHAILPGIIDGPKGQATVLYLMDQFYADTASGYDPVFEANAFFDDLFASMVVGEKRSFDVSVDQGSWRMFAFAFWNRADGQFNVTYGGRGTERSHQLGECRYDVLVYDVDLKIRSRTLLAERRHYAPELGLVIGRTPLDGAGSAGKPHWFIDIVAEEY